MWHEDDWGITGWLSAGLLMLVVWTILIAGTVLVTRSARGHGTSGAHPGGNGAQFLPARRILDERFARGELSEDDYQQQCAVLSSR